MGCPRARLGREPLQPYDRALFALALPQIQASLAIDEAHVGYLGSHRAPRCSPGICSRDAGRPDRSPPRAIGHHRRLHGAHGATALVASTTTFFACQFLSTAFSQAGVILAAVVLAEELDAEHRGWGIGAFSPLPRWEPASLPPCCRSWIRLAKARGFSTRSASFRSHSFALWWRRLPETRRFDAYRHGEEQDPGGLAGSWRPSPQPLLRVTRAGFSPSWRSSLSSRSVEPRRISWARSTSSRHTAGYPQLHAVPNGGRSRDSWERRCRSHQ